MKAWCDTCGKYIESNNCYSKIAHYKWPDLEFDTEELYDICPICGDEIWTLDICDYNISTAHLKYCEITRKEPRKDAKEKQAESLKKIRVKNTSVNEGLEEYKPGEASTRNGGCVSPQK